MHNLLYLILLVHPHRLSTANVLKHLFDGRLHAFQQRLRIDTDPENQQDERYHYELLTPTEVAELFSSEAVMSLPRDQKNTPPRMESVIKKISPGAIMYLFWFSMLNLSISCICL